MGPTLIGRYTQTMYSRDNIRRWITISKDMYVNEGIRARELRIIDHNGDQLGIKTRNEALEIATRANLDLVLVAPTSETPSSSYHGLWEVQV